MSSGSFGRASFPYAGDDLTLRARVLMPAALTWIQRRAVAESRFKNRSELRQEAVAWALCGEWSLSRRVWNVRPSTPITGN